MAEPTKLCTIGFSQKSLREFMNLLRSAGVTKVVDIRLHNTSQLSGYAKKDDLAFILEAFGIQYEHVLDLAPTEEIFNEYKKGKDWEAFQRDFTALIKSRGIERLWKSPVFDSPVNCLLCGEHEPEHCHRRWVAEYLKGHDPEIEIQHLK